MLFNSIVALVNSPLHLQPHSQFPPGIYDPLYVFVCQGDTSESGFNMFVSINGPLHLQIHFQPPPGAYNNASPVNPTSTLIHQHGVSGVDSFFLKGTAHSVHPFIISISFPFEQPKTTTSSPKTTIDSSTMVFWAFACRISQHSSFPMTTSQLLSDFPSFRLSPAG